MCCTDTDLAQLLQDVLNPDNFQRNEAENRLRMLCVTPGGATRLAQQTCSGLLSHSQSLVALSTLKQVAIPSVRSGKELLEVLQLLLRALESRLDLQESMQKQMASVVAKVVTVMESSGDSLCGSNNQFYANAIAMITERIQEPLRHDATQQYQHGLVLLLELMEVIAEESLLWEEFLGLVPHLLQVGLAEGAAREGVTSQNLEVVMANLQRQSLAQKAVSRLLQQSVQLSGAKEAQRTWRNYWCEYFSIIQERYLTVPCSTFFSQTLPPRLLQRLQLAQLTCLSLGVSLGVDVLRSGSQRKTLVTSSLPQGILMALNLDTTLFHQISVNGAESEAECDDLEALLSQIVSMRWSLFGTLVLRPTAVQLRKEVLGGEGPSLAYLQLIQAYTYLPQRCARAWEEDPCSFLRQESEREDELFWTCRDVVASIYEKSIQVIGPIFMRDSLEYFHEQICDEANMSGHDHEREAALFLMQQVVCSCRAAIVRWGAPDFSYLFNIVLSHDAHGIPILAARALSLLTELVLFMSQSGVDVYLLTDTCLLPQALQSLESCCPSGDALNVVQVSACKLLFRTMDRLRPSTLGEKFSEGQLALLRLIENSNLHDEALYLVFDTLRKWLECVHKLHEHPTSSAPAQYSLHPTFHKSLFQSWRSHIQDPNVNELVVPLFRLALCSPGGEVGLLEELPWISKVLEDQTDDAMRCVTPYVIRLLRTLFRHGSDQVAEQFAQQSLGSLCALLLTTDESASLDASSGCLSALLRRCPQVDSIQVAAAPAALVMAMPNNPTSVLPNPSLSSALAAIVVRILDPSLPEVILRNIGRTLVTFLTYAAHFHESDIQSIIIANVERLQMVKMESVAEQLVLPLAYLLQKYPDALLSLLEQRGLVVHTFEQWLPRVMNLTSRSDILHTCETLLSWLGSSLAASRDLSQCMVSLSFSINTLGPQLTAAQPTYSLPLDLAIVIAVNRALCALLQRGDADGFGASEGSSTNSEDDKGLFREDDEDSTWTEAEEVEEGEEDTVPATAHTTAAILSERPHAAVAEAQSQMIRAFAGLLPLLPAFGSQASNYFSSTEQARISDFLQLMQAELGSS